MLALLPLPFNALTLASYCADTSIAWIVYVLASRGALKGLLAAVMSSPDL